MTDVITGLCENDFVELKATLLWFLGLWTIRNCITPSPREPVAWWWHMLPFGIDLFLLGFVAWPFWALLGTMLLVFGVHEWISDRQGRFPRPWFLPEPIQTLRYQVRTKHGKSRTVRAELLPPGSVPDCVPLKDA